MTTESSEEKPGQPLSIPQVEEEVTEFWEKENIFQKSLDKTKDGAPYTFYDGPPFATGLPHYGHILASTIKDLIPRYQTMRGRFVRRRWGWDCHGLPIEALVEKKLGISGKQQIEEIGIQTFNETCRSMVLQYAEEWGKTVRRLGRWVDFDNSYKTMDRDYMESVWWGFKQIYDRGLAYEGRKVLLYCPRCETPISNFEVAMDNSYKDVIEESVYVKFKVKGEENTFLLAWTTTPWTLPGNVALAVGKDIDYVKVKTGTETFIVAKALAEKVLPAGYAVQKEMKGSELIGLSYEPLFDVPDVAASDNSFKVYAADFVTTEDGTGIVHTAVVYGEDDYQLGLHESLPVVPLLDEKGHFNDKAPELVRGQYFKKSEKAVKEDLEARGLLLKRETYAHSYPHCWRCGTALYYNAIPAWFINVQKIKPELLKTNNEQVSWFPGHLKHGRYEKSVAAAPDWNISRNRYWGNPIPAWKCENCSKVRVIGGLEELAARAAPSKNQYVFLRHGESDHNILRLYSGNIETQKKYHLTPKGVSQVEAAAAGLQGRKIGAIYASDFERTRETAAIARKILNVPAVHEDTRLRDINVGVFDDRRLEEYGKFFADDAERFTKCPPDGETMADVIARAWAFIREAEQEHDGKTILIVSHEDTIWAFEAVLRGWDFPAMQAAKDTVADGVFIHNAEVHEAALLPLPRNGRGIVDMHRPYIDAVTLQCDCGGIMRRTPEIFDSWVEAGSMPFSEYHYPFENKAVFEGRFPGQFVVEYIAQTRAWFYVMHVIAQIIFGRAPFENVVTTGTILAEDGSKMSKSKNNYPDPWIVINKYGVDSLRFYLANSVVMQADNLNFSLKDLENTHRKVTMLLWNVRQYFVTYAAHAGWKPVPRGTDTAVPGIAAGALPHVLDRWIMARTKELVAGVTDHLDVYDTVRATRLIEAYIDDLSTWYLRRSRGREDSSFFPNFHDALVTLARVLAPFMPHIAEAVYRDLRAEGEPESVHLTDWPGKQELSAADKQLLEDMALVREAASLVLAARKSADVPVRQALANMSLMTSKGEQIALTPELAEILLSEVNIKKMGIISGAGPAVYKAASEKHVLLMDLNLTDELRLEGLTRALERFVQEMRKARGFKVGEVAVLQYETADAGLEKAFGALDKKKTYLTKVERNIENVTVSESVRFEEGGASARLTIGRV